MSRLGPQPTEVTVSLATRTHKPEDLTGSSSETETESQIDTITTVGLTAKHIRQSKLGAILGQHQQEQKSIASLGAI